MNLIELRSEFGRAAVVACAEIEVQQALERRGVPRRFLQTFSSKCVAFWVKP